jgi:hypothetical protein
MIREADVLDKGLRTVLGYELAQQRPSMGPISSFGQRTLSAPPV